MKNLLIVFAWLFCCHIGAQPWFEHWENGKNYEIKENYTSAIDAYTKALETGAFYENFHVRYDRAMCFMMVEDYISALKDLEIFLEKSDLKISDKLKALRLKGSALFFLKHTEEARNLYDETNLLDCNIPILEKYENTVVVRNVPNCKCTQKFMEKLYVKMEFCESVEEIRKFNDTWFMYRKPCNKCKEPCEQKKKVCTCGCQNGAKTSLSLGGGWEARDTLPGPAPLPGDRDRENGNTIEQCYGQCNQVTTFGKEMCLAWFNLASCKAACILTAETLNSGCKWCCSNGDFWKKCIEPFLFLKEMVKCPNDPAWD